MSVRKIYETAFDSKIKPQNDTDYLDDLLQSPLICTSPIDQQDESKLRLPMAVPENCGRANQDDDTVDNPVPKNPVQGGARPRFETPTSKTSSKCFLPFEHDSKKCASQHSNNNNNCSNNNNNTTCRIPGRFSRTYSMPKCLNEAHKYKKYHTEESLQSAMSSVSRSPPVRPHSDPLDRRKRDSSLQARPDGPPNRVFRLPLEQYNSNKDTSSSKTFSPSTEFKKLGVEDEKDKQPTSSGPDNDDVLPNKQSFPESKQSDGDCQKGPSPLPLGNNDTNATCSDMQTEPSATREFSSDTGDQNTNPRTVRDDMKRNHSEMSAARLKLQLNLSQPTKKPRHHILNFWTPGHDAFHEKIDPNLELEKQGWYHGTINHKDAENALRFLQEGSFLVRSCAKSQKSYSLSIKSSNGVMHMKISQLSTGRYVLKQQNEPFDSIPEMVYHFSMHPLSVYGLEHVILKNPVVSQLL